MKNLKFKFNIQNALDDKQSLNNFKRTIIRLTSINGNTNLSR